ncbi:MAG: molybdenum cofactor biosynthesis protein A [Methanosaeta sp. PtaU1.Bin112]|nr:MAG: molybdenum cofactor biosynthesis protein A [Methanosaeta sp. PtaU1.Bin112]
MKKSKFNICVPMEGNDRIAVFNAYTGAISLLDEEAIAALNMGNLDLLGESLLMPMKDRGFLVENEVDETRLYEYEVKNKIFNPVEYEFSIFTNSDCNLNCSYCGCQNRSLICMDNQALERTIGFVKKQSLEGKREYINLRLFGGEPLRYPNIVLRLLEEISSWSRSHGMIFNSALITNGTLLSQHIVERLCKTLSVVQLTLEGSKEHHDKVRRHKNGNGTYEEVVGSSLLLQRKEIPICLRLHISPESYRDIELLFDDLIRRGLNGDNIGLSICPAVPGSNICSFYPLSCTPWEEYLDLLSEVWRMAVDYGFNVLAKPTGNHIILSCPFVSDCSAIIDPVGNVYNCLMTVPMVDKRAALAGDDGELAAIAYRMIDFRTRDALHFPQCCDCSYLPLCNGGCAHKALTCSGTYHSPHCVSSKDLVHEKIKVYLEQRMDRVI